MLFFKKQLPKKLLKLQEQGGLAFAVDELQAFADEMDGSKLVLIHDIADEFLFSESDSYDERKRIYSYMGKLAKIGYNVKGIPVQLYKYISRIEEDEQTNNMFLEYLNISEIKYSDILYLLCRYNSARMKYEEYFGTKLKKCRYPKYIIQDINYMNEEIRKASMLPIEYEKAVNRLKKFNYDFEFEGKKYISRVPMTIKELFSEGIAMHNCLIMRDRDIASKNWNVVMIRTEDNLPFIDICMNEKFQIMWAIYDFHKEVLDENQKMVFEWYRKNIKNIDTINEMYSTRRG